MKKLRTRGTADDFSDCKPEIILGEEGNFKENFIYLCLVNRFNYIPDIVPRRKAGLAEKLTTKAELQSKQQRSKKTPTLRVQSSKHMFENRDPISSSAIPESGKRNSSIFLSGSSRKPSIPGQPRTKSCEDGHPLGLLQQAFPTQDTIRRTSSLMGSRLRKKSSMEDLLKWSNPTFLMKPSALLGVHSFSGYPGLGGQESALAIPVPHHRSSIYEDGLGQVSHRDGFFTDTTATNSDTETVYTTFSIAPTRVDYFRPCIQVEQDVSEDFPPAMREVHIRGWKVDEPMMDVLTQCWAMLPRLHTINLWNVSLDCGSVTILADGLPQFRSLRTLLLDANSLEGCPVSRLLCPSSHLQHLSMRFCCLTDVEAHGLAVSLKSSSPHCSLLTLNLSTNHITDVGMGDLAEALKVNRTLLALNLASNRVGDEGVTSLCSALTQYSLTHEELVMRRRLLSQQMEKENIKPPLNVLKKLSCVTARSSTASNGKSLMTGLTICRQSSKDQLRPRAQSRERKLTHSFLDVGGQTKAKLSATKLELKRRASRKSRQRNSEHKLYDSDNTVEELGENPLTRIGYARDGQLWLMGNCTLLSLNLARNRISRKGIQALKDTVTEQYQNYVQGKQSMPGLRRLVMHHNLVPETDNDLRSLNAIMRLRDPTYRMPLLRLDRTYVTPCSLALMI